MRATLSDDPAAALALRVTLAFAGALTVAEAADLALTFIAPLAAATLAAGRAPSLTTALALPLTAWAIAAGVAVLVEAFAGPAQGAFLVIVFLGLWAGFSLSLKPRLGALGLLTLVFFAIAPMRLLAYPEASTEAVNDIARNVLVGALAAWAAGRLLPGEPARAAPPPVALVPPAAAALAATFAAWLVWVYEPPAPGAVLIGLLIALRADPGPGLAIVRDRFGAALLGGLCAVVAVTLIDLAPGLPMMFLSLALLAWPCALVLADGGPARGLAAKTLNVVAILVGESYSPLFEDAAERLGVRIVGVFIGLAFALAVLALLAPTRRDAVEARS